MSETPSKNGPPTEAESAPQKPKRSRWPFYVTLGVFLFVVVFILLPNWIACGTPARTTAQTNACIANLKLINGVVQQWALEKHKLPTDTPTISEIEPYLKGEIMPRCPGGGSYALHTVSQSPTCNVPGHSL
jgi:hypothetical protein